MSMTLIDELLTELTDAEAEMLKRAHCQAIATTGLNLAMSPGSGKAIALRYLRMELGPLVHQSKVGPATPPPRNPLDGPRRGIFHDLEVEGVEIRVIQLKASEWRCPVSDLSYLLHPTNNRSWLGTAITRETQQIINLRPLGFVGVTETAIACLRDAKGKKRCPRFSTLSEQDTRIILKNRGEVCP